MHDVSRQRIALHIPAFRPHKSKKWTRAEEKILGTAEDKAIAMRLGRTRNAVLQLYGGVPIPQAFERARPRELRLAGLLDGTPKQQGLDIVPKLRPIF